MWIRKSGIYAAGRREAITEDWDDSGADNTAPRIAQLPVEAAQRESILTIARRLGLGEPASRGDEWAVLCPLHDDHRPSLYLSEQKGLWYCHVCGEGGDGIKLVERAMNLTFAEAVRWIAR